MEDKRPNIGHAVCAVIKNEEGKVLAVSRKDDPNKIGLPGGKVDPEDGTDYIGAIVREVKEETGVDIFNAKEIDTRVYSMNPEHLRTQHCFVAEYKGEIASREELDEAGEFGIVKWLDKSEFTFYTEYNNWMFEIAGI